MSFRFLVFLSMGFTLCGQAIQGAAKEPAEGAPFVLSHDYDLYSEIPELVGQGHLRSKVKPAAVTLGALQWLTSENGKPPRGWYRVQLNGWMVAKGKEGRPHMSQGKDGWWNAGAKDSDGTFHAGTLNIHSDTVLDAGSIVGTLREGASVYVSQQRIVDGREWVYGVWTGWIREDNAPNFPPPHSIRSHADFLSSRSCCHRLDTHLLGSMH